MSSSVIGSSLAADEDTQAEREESAASEILSLTDIFSTYGFSFEDLASCSPRTKKTKNSCALAVREILKDNELYDELKMTKKLPMARLSKLSGVSKKILDRHRKYIIAACEVWHGDFPIVREYMHFIKYSGEDT